MDKSNAIQSECLTEIKHTTVIDVTYWLGLEENSFDDRVYGMIES